MSADPRASSTVGGAEGMPGGRRWAGLGAGLAAAAVIEVSVAAVLAVQQGLTFAYLLEGHEVSAAVVGVAFGAVGAAVVWRQPRHRLGWLFILVSQLLCLSGVGARYGSVSPPLPLSGVDLGVEDRDTLAVGGELVGVAVGKPLDQPVDAAAGRGRSSSG